MRKEQRQRLEKFAAGDRTGHWSMTLKGHRLSVMHMPLGTVQGEPEHWLMFHKRPDHARDADGSPIWEQSLYGSALGCSGCFKTFGAVRDEVLRRVATIEAETVARKSGGNVIAFPARRDSREMTSERFRAAIRARVAAGGPKWTGDEIVKLVVLQMTEERVNP